jgi:hypothetical protein
MLNISPQNHPLQNNYLISQKNRAETIEGCSGGFEGSTLNS